MELFREFGLGQQLLLLLGGFIVGLNKGGIKGIDMLNVTIMALLFGTKSSTGIVLPLLCIGDILAVIYYKKNVKWPLFWKLIGWMAVGILLAVFFGKDINEALFKKIFAGIIIITVIILLYMEWKKVETVPDNWLFTPSLGLSAGIATMLGNLAGAFANVYFMAQRINKNDFIGTGAWVFLVINLFKMPFQVYYWKNINTSTLALDLVLLPVLLLGFGLGVLFVKKINDQQYRKLIIALTLLGGITILFR
jgi:uncharacterized protein